MAREFQRANNEYLSLASSLGLTPPISGAAWVNLQSTPAQNDTVFSVGIPGSNVQFACIINGSRQVLGTYSDGITSSTTVTTTATITNGQWHHVAFASNIAARTVWLDGVGASNTVSKTSITPTTIEIGRRSELSATRYLHAYVHMVTFWPGMLTQDEVTAMSKGVHPITVRRNFVEHIDLSKTLVGLKGNIFTENGTISIVNNSGRVFFIPPSNKQIFDAPSQSQNITSNLTNGSIVLSGQPISVSNTSNKSVTLANGLIGLSGQQPIASNTQNKLSNTNSGLIDIAGNIISANTTSNRTSQLLNGTVNVLAQQPTSTATNNQSGNKISNINFGLISIVGQTLAVSNTKNKTSNNQAGLLGLQAGIPEITGSKNKTVSIVNGSIQFQATNPTSDSTSNKSANTLTGLLAVTGFSITATKTNNKSASILSGILNINANSPETFVLGSFSPPPIERLVKVTKSNRIIRVM